MKIEYNYGVVCAIIGRKREHALQSSTRDTYSVDMSTALGGN